MQPSRLNPSMPYPYYLLAHIYMQSGDTQKAQKWNARFQDLKRAQDSQGTLGPPSYEPADGLAPSLNIAAPQEVTLPTSPKAQ